MLELLNNPISTCSQKVRLTLHEKGIPFTDTTLDFRKKDHLTPEYLKLNPDGVVPTLLHDGRPVCDSSVIMEYLDEVFPQTPLSPADPYDRAKMRKWLRFIEEVPTAAIRIPSFNKVFIRHRKGLSEDDLDKDTKARTLRKTFYEEMGRDGFSDAVTQALEGHPLITIDRAEVTGLPPEEWDKVIIATFAEVPAEAAADWKPTVVLCRENNKIADDAYVELAGPKRRQNMLQ